ncbi:cytochrome P450 [Obba rivulosa]|uniref:Cytochrome P450 n=1 Tax=Obba rivulosa TaxID=1052685 RepID=A0A8E2DHC0_9APHY|nr:cytochrome P450 [Obba rivulosa]
MHQLQSFHSLLDFVQTKVLPATLLLGVISILLRLYRRFVNSERLLLPPGPPGNILTGNIRAVAQGDAPRTLAKYKEQYGELVMFQGMGSRVLVLNSLKAMNDLFDKRASIYSDRPTFVFGGELLGLNNSVVFLPYAEEWRAHRKLLRMVLSSAQVKQYHGMQEDVAASLCKGLLEKPNDFFPLLRMSAGRIIIAITYGIPASDAQTEYIMNGERSAGIFAKAAAPGNYLCDFIPILKYAPSWVPFKREATKSREILKSVRQKPFDHVRREMDAGSALPSFVQSLLVSPPQDMTKSDFERRVLWVAGSMFGAGVETVYGTLLAFMMAMVLNRDKQRLAQDEIDRVVGKERLPTVKDRQDLPYIDAIIKETMRWQPVSPMGIPRRSVEDDVYGSYHIPKQTIIIPNVWAIAYEANPKYKPEAFIPERYLDPDQDIPDPATWAFGFGRRICPGRDLAGNSLFIIMATILAVFDIAPPENGIVVQEFRVGIGRIPKPFQCRIIARSKDKANLVLARAAHNVV